jgi:hypothetical protein
MFFSCLRIEIKDSASDDYTTFVGRCHIHGSRSFPGSFNQASNCVRGSIFSVERTLLYGRIWTMFFYDVVHFLCRNCRRRRILRILGARHDTRRVGIGHRGRRRRGPRRAPRRSVAARLPLPPKSIARSRARCRPEHAADRRCISRCPAPRAETPKPLSIRSV